MDFTLPSEIETLRRRYAEFVDSEILPVERDHSAWGEGENIDLAPLAILRGKAKSAGLWAPQVPRELGGLGLSMVGMAACYEAMARSLFGPSVFNCAAPDDGNMMLLAKVATPAQRDRWLRPIVDGAVRSSFAMTEPMPGAGSDPSAMRTRAERRDGFWVVSGHKSFITGAAAARHFILLARTSEDR